MSVAIPVIDHVDPDLRRIYLKTGVRQIHMIDDIYYEMRNLRRTDESLRGWYSFVEAGGNVQKTATTYTPRYLTMLTDPRPITTAIVPAGDASTPDSNHTLIVKGEGITDQGTSGSACFDKTSLLNSVDIEFEPPGAEIIRLDQALIEFASFAGHIHVDVTSSYTGTGYDNQGNPIGSPLAPVNNWADAHAISIARGIRPFLIYSSTTIATVDFNGAGSMHHVFRGISPFVQVTVDPSADVANCDFQNMTLIGDLDGVNVVRDCSIGPIAASGFFEKCAFWGTVDLLGDTSVLECYSQVVGLGAPEFRPGEWDLIVRNFAGSFTLSGTAANHVSSIGVTEGNLTIAADVLDGEVHLRGEPVAIIDNSGGIAQIFDETESSRIRAIKTTTDQMVFTKANELDVNVKSNNDATLHGTGVDGDLWRGTP
jgi:hypothetical protein